MLLSINSYAFYIDKVPAKYETESVSSIGDAADDVAIWVNHRDPEDSMIIGTDKKAGILIYNLKGKILKQHKMGRINNIDIRGNILVGSNRTYGTLDFYYFDPSSLSFDFIDNVRAKSGHEAYGACLYKSSNGVIYGVLTYVQGGFDQWKLDVSRKDKKLKHIRYVNLNSKSEGCVFDDKRNILFVAEEDIGIWVFNAEEKNKDKWLLDRVRKGSALVADVEGLAVYNSEHTSDYLIASSQGDNTFVFYNLDNDFSFEKKVSIKASKGIDKVTHTDGVEVIATYLGPDFPEGIMVVQDDDNVGENQNFKLVSWKDIFPSDR
jgi:3-phytase